MNVWSVLNRSITVSSSRNHEFCLFKSICCWNKSIAIEKKKNKGTLLVEIFLQSLFKKVHTGTGIYRQESGNLLLLRPVFYHYPSHLNRLWGHKCPSEMQLDEEDKLHKRKTKSRNLCHMFFYFIFVLNIYWNSTNKSLKANSRDDMKWRWNSETAPFCCLLLPTFEKNIQVFVLTYLTIRRQSLLKTSLCFSAFFFLFNIQSYVWKQNFPNSDNKSYFHKTFYKIKGNRIYNEPESLVFIYHQ